MDDLTRQAGGRVAVRGRRGAGGRWRYRATCPCGWSLEAPALLFRNLGGAIDRHREESRRCRTPTADSTTRPPLRGGS
ncbi:hypothetical protein GCM10010282_50700 [Streptomyces roseolus]|nr:hypothetical protein GCM10010282_50700 [Streptomyces roseolus]